MNLENIQTWVEGIKENCSRATLYFLPSDREEINFMLDKIMEEITSGRNGTDVSDLVKAIADFRVAVITSDEIIKGGNGSPFFESLSNLFRELGRIQLIEKGFKVPEGTWSRQRTFGNRTLPALSSRPLSPDLGLNITEFQVP